MEFKSLKPGTVTVKTLLWQTGKEQEVFLLTTAFPKQWELPRNESVSWMNSSVPKWYMIPVWMNKLKSILALNPYLGTKLWAHTREHQKDLKVVSNSQHQATQSGGRSMVKDKGSVLLGGEKSWECKTSRNPGPQYFKLSTRNVQFGLVF